MTGAELLVDAFGRIREAVHQVADGLTPEQATARLDPDACGFPLQVYVTATLARHDLRTSNVFDELIRSTPQIITADTVAGETDYLLTVVARDVAELQQVLSSLALRGGSRLVTYLRLAEVKPPSRLPLAQPRPL